MRRQPALLIVLAELLLGIPCCLAAESGVLRVGISGSYPPFAQLPKVVVPQVVDLTQPSALTPAPAPQPSGFDVDIARQFAAASHRKVEFVPFEWPQLAELVQRGSIDLAMSGITLRADRALLGRFSRPYLATGAVAVVRATAADRAAHIDWLDAPEIKLAVNRGGYLEKLARSRFASASLVLVDDNRDLPQMVVDGQVDAALAERFEAQAWQARGLRVTPTFTTDLKAYWGAPGAAAVVAELDDWLAARERDGWLDRQRQKWFGSASHQDVNASCVAAVRARLAMRLDLMPYVAAAKRAAGQLVEDPAQEARVLQSAREAAQRHQLSPDRVAELFRHLIEAAKLIQVQAMMQGGGDLAAPTLVSVRESLMFESAELIAELARCRGRLEDLAGRPLTSSVLPPARTRQILAAAARAAA